jgi:hypothetical protein
VLKVGGRVIVAVTHPAELYTPLLKYQKGFRIHGFVVELAVDKVLRPISKRDAPYHFVLKKVADDR